jgi:hypothetical protein
VAASIDSAVSARRRVMRSGMVAGSVAVRPS